MIRTTDKLNHIRRNPKSFTLIFNTRTVPWKVYYDLIRTLYWEPRPAGRRDIHVHHIMPKCCYKYGLVDSNNMESEYNKVYVTEMMHVILNYCLFRCAKDSRVKEDMNLAWQELNKRVGLTKSMLDYIVYGGHIAYGKIQ